MRDLGLINPSKSLRQLFGNSNKVVGIRFINKNDSYSIQQ